VRLKTFIATYLLFLCVLFTSVGIVSVYLNNSQMNMLREKSVSQFQTITSSLGRDIAALYSRSATLPAPNFYTAVDNLISGYVRYYSRHNVHLSVADLTLSGQPDVPEQSEVSFVNLGDGHFINIIGLLPEPFGNLQLNYNLDITENIADMRNIQNILMISAVAFSVIAGIALHFILASIFRPLHVVAKVSREIADGQFGERININGKNEIAQVAFDFNKMAERIDRQIMFLEAEAINKQQFVDNFAHEIRTPLTSIYGYAEYLQKASLDEDEIIESAEYIMSEASHMKKIANSLLELATLRDYVPVKNEVSISGLFDDMTKIFKIPFDCRVRADTVLGQEDLLKSLLTNLCSNAMKAGATKIILESEQYDNRTSISVADNGCGIPKESLPKIMEPFYRVDKSRSREHGGTGLGMALCRQIAEAHDAEIFIKSAVGAGTIVEIIFTTSK
jgi:signal transduction histidine kinase